MQPNTAIHPLRSAVLVLGLALIVAACGGSAVPAPATPAPVTPAPSQPGGPGGGTGGGDDDGSGGGSGSVPGDPGGGIVDPGLPGGGPGDDLGEPRLVEPVPGAILVRDARAAALSAAVNGRRVAVKVAFWGGVEPCDVLAGVTVARDGNDITLTVKSGAGPNARDVACIEIAVLKATIVDLGELEPGTYTIRAAGDAPPIEVVVS